MRVTWISDSAPAGRTTDTGHFERHRLASLRFRVGIPARALSALGFATEFIGLDTPEVLRHLVRERTDAVVFSKLSTPRGPGFQAFVTAYLGTADHVRAAGLPLVVDLVDNVFETDRAEFFAALLERATAVTVPSMALAERCRVRVQAPVHVVPDPVEGERRAPRFAPRSRRIELAWFGGQLRTFADLAGTLPALGRFAEGRPLRLTVVMNADERVKARLAQASSGGLDTRFAEWSLEGLAAVLDASDAVLLPGDAADPMRAVASANRLVRALWAGRAVIASPLPAYLPFGGAAVLREDLVEGLRQALAQPREVERGIADGQALIEHTLAPAPVARLWAEVLERART